MSIPIAFTTSDYCMLDADNQTKRRVTEWTRKYRKKYHLGSALITMSSDEGQLNLLGERLYNFTIIFGERVPWQENSIHMENALKDGITNKTFIKMRFQGFVSERVNRKCRRKAAPRFFRYFPDPKKRNEGCMEYMKWWKWFRRVG